MIVSNTTPISNLLHLQLLGLFGKLFAKVMIPQAVYDEVNAFWKHDVLWQKCIYGGVLNVMPVANSLLIQQLKLNLHLGEAEVIALALEQKADLCLIDDRDGRSIAESNGLAISGTIGFLIKAKQRNYIPNIAPLLDALRNDFHFWISDDVYMAALKLTGESF